MRINEFQTKLGTLKRRRPFQKQDQENIDGGEEQAVTENGKKLTSK